MVKKYAATITLRDIDYSYCPSFRDGNYYYYECDNLRTLNEYLYSKLCLGRCREIVGILIEEFNDDK